MACFRSIADAKAGLKHAVALLARVVTAVAAVARDVSNRLSIDMQSAIFYTAGNRPATTVT
jgi:hypothetical protein